MPLYEKHWIIYIQFDSILCPRDQLENVRIVGNHMTTFFNCQRESLIRVVANRKPEEFHGSGNDKGDGSPFSDMITFYVIQSKIHN